MGVLFIISTQIVFNVDRFKPGFHKACSMIDRVNTMWLVRRIAAEP